VLYRTLDQLGRPAAEAKARTSRSISDPAGWYTSSVTPNAVSPAIFCDICSAVPVNAMEVANGMSSNLGASALKSVGIEFTRTGQNDSTRNRGRIARRWESAERNFSGLVTRIIDIATDSIHVMSGRHRSIFDRGLRIPGESIV
jgi:hypothetical protein